MNEARSLFRTHNLAFLRPDEISSSSSFKAEQQTFLSLSRAEPDVGVNSRRTTFARAEGSPHFKTAPGEFAMKDKAMLTVRRRDFDTLF